MALRHSLVCPACLLVLALSAALAAGATVIVDGDGGGDFTTIGPALTAASNGDTVLVMRGTYVIAEPLSFRGKAVTIRSQNGARDTVVHMEATPADQNWGSVFAFENGEGERSVLEGRTVTGGSGSVWGIGPFQDRCGGGILCVQGASPTVRDCALAGNKADFGGGLYVDAASRPSVVRCTVTENFAYQGGGVFSAGGDAAFTDCTFRLRAR